jgi:hypothetical protein
MAPATIVELTLARGRIATGHRYEVVPASNAIAPQFLLYGGREDHSSSGKGPNKEDIRLGGMASPFGEAGLVV